MKVKVTEQFRDKNTGKLHNVGEELEVSVERLNEILSVGSFVKILETEEKPKTEEKTEEKTTTAAKKTAAKKKTETK